MNLRRVFFRKMTILYGLIITLLTFELFIVGRYSIETKEQIDEAIRMTPIVLTYETEQNSIKGAEIKEKTKSSSRIIKVDETLKGDECVLFSEYSLYLKVGDKTKISIDSEAECIVKEFKGYDMFPYEMYLSQEKYDSIESNRYSYLVKVNGLSELMNFENQSGVEIYDTTGFFNESYYGQMILYHENLIIITISIIALVSIIVILFVNTSLYIKANSKKTKKKVKDNKALINIESSTLTIALSMVLAYILYFIALG